MFVRSGLFVTYYKAILSDPIFYLPPLPPLLIVIIKASIHIPTPDHLSTYMILVLVMNKG